jgi:hypothetical protein
MTKRKDPAALPAQHTAALRETMRVAVRDKWRDGCARVCEIERPDALSNVCACDEMARLVVDTLGEGK